MKKYIRFDNGKTVYVLPDCKVCGKRSNTTNKETARNAKRYGRICRKCVRINVPFLQKKEEIFEKSREAIFPEKKSIWQKIKRLFK